MIKPITRRTRVTHTSRTPEPKKGNVGAVSNPPAPLTHRPRVARGGEAAYYAANAKGIITL